MKKVSENLKTFVPLCTVIIAFTAVLSFLLVGVNALLSPVKANQTRIEAKIDKVMLSKWPTKRTPDLTDESD